MKKTLAMLKVDLGITHTVRDEYLENLLLSCRGELSDKGVMLNLDNVQDVMLLSDYAAWIYRKRGEDVSMSQNLQFRIRNRQVKKRAQANS